MAHLGHIPGNIPILVLLINDRFVVLVDNKTKSSRSESPIWVAWVFQWLVSTLPFQTPPNGRPIL